MFLVIAVFILSFTIYSESFQNGSLITDDCFFKFANRGPSNFRFWQQLKKVDLIDCKKSCFIVEDEQPIQKNSAFRRPLDDCSFVTFDRCDKSCYIYRGGKFNQKYVTKLLVDSKHKDFYELKKDADISKCFNNLLTMKAKDEKLKPGAGTYATVSGHCQSYSGQYSTYFMKTQVSTNLAASDLALQKDATIAYSVIPSEDLCLDICKNERNPASDRPIPCSGFYFDSTSKKCTFLAENSNLQKSKALDIRSEIFYFEKFCIKLQDERNCESTVVKHPQKVLIGFAAEVASTMSIFECVEKCYNSWIYYGFDCYSIMYYHENALNCVLNTQNHEDHGDLFLTEEISIVDYVDLNCRKSEVKDQLESDAIIREVKDVLNNNQEPSYKRRL